MVVCACRWYTAARLLYRQLALFAYVLLQVPKSDTQQAPGRAAKARRSSAAAAAEGADEDAGDAGEAAPGAATDEEMTDVGATVQGTAEGGDAEEGAAAAGEGRQLPGLGAQGMLEAWMPCEVSTVSELVRNHTVSCPL
jgi:hypothetical protein